MRTQSRDTSEIIERVMIHGHRQFSSIQRFQHVRSLTGSISAMRSTDHFSRADALRQRYGMNWTGDQSVAEAPPFDIQSTLFTVMHLADDLRATIVLTGSVACCLYGFPRMVHDIDVVMTASTAASISQQLMTSWLPLSCSSTQWSLVDPSTLVKVDLMTTHGRIPTDLLIDRRRSLQITDDEAITVLSAEDVVLTRLAWYHDQGTFPDDQWNDLMGVVKVHTPFLDQLYLRTQAKVLHIEPILDQLLTDCDEGDLLHGESYGYANRRSSLESRAGSL